MLTVEQKSKYVVSMRISREKWRQKNIDKVNARRRELRANKRKDTFKEVRCLLCEFPLPSKFAGVKGARLYCNDCTERNSDAVRRHRWRRYWQSKQKILTPSKVELYWKSGKWEKIPKEILKQLIEGKKPMERNEIIK